MQKVFYSLIIILMMSQSLYSINEFRMIKDMNGNEILVPSHVERVAPMIGAFVQITCLLGGEHKISSPTQELPSLFYKIYPSLQYNKIRSGGSLGLESIIATKAQVVYGPISFFNNQANIEQLNKLGTTAIAISNMATIDDIKACIKLIGDILGDDAPFIARDFITYYENITKRVEMRTKLIANKLNVLTLNLSNGGFTTIGKSDIGVDYINIAGGEALAVDDKINKNPIKTINAEQVIVWNPDIIITNNQYNKNIIINHPSFHNINAIKTNRVYVIPTGIYLWSVRSAEGVLQPLWLAKTLYPESFSDISMEQEVRYFYNIFYHYKISNDEIALILKGNEQ